MDNTNLKRNFQFIEAVLPAGVGMTVDIPGPNPGYARLFDGIQIVAAVVGAPLSGNTADIIVPGPIAYRFSGGLGITGLSSQNLLLTGLAPGEICRVTNNCLNAGIIVACYVDVPLENLSFIRLNVTNTNQVLIPEPEVGFYSRFMQSFQMTSASRTIVAKIQMFNGDSISHTLEFSRGANLISRSPATTTLNIGTPVPPLEVPIINGQGAMFVKALSTVSTTTPYVITGMFETLPIV